MGLEIQYRKWWVKIKMNCEKIKQMIALQLPAAQVRVESQDDIHFSATVVSELFEGENLVKRQRRVYAALGEHIHNGNIHALTLKTATPQEWQSNQGGMHG